MSTNFLGLTQPQPSDHFDPQTTTTADNQAIDSFASGANTRLNILESSPSWSPPSTGIPFNDLDGGVQNSLNKADTSVQQSALGATNGVATLDANSKLSSSQIPDQLLGQMIRAGDWNAATAVATLTTAGQSALGTSSATITLTNDTAAITGYAANQLNYYVTQTAGTFAGIAFNVGDWLTATASGWDRIANTDAVQSVNGKTGAVVLNAADVGVIVLNDNTLGGNTPNQTQAPSQSAVKTYVDGKVPNFSSAGLANDSWATINANLQANLGRQFYNVGDTKTISIGGSNFTVQLLDFDRDGAKAVFGMQHLLAQTYPFEATNINSNGWSGSQMRVSTMNTLWSQLTGDLQAVIKPVIKLTSAMGSQANGNFITSTVDRLWLFSEAEIYGEPTPYSWAGQGQQYEFWRAAGSTSGNALSALPARVKNLSNGTGSANFWWLRSPRSSGTTSFCFVNFSGIAGGSTASDAWGVCLGFCV